MGDGNLVVVVNYMCEEDKTKTKTKTKTKAKAKTMTKSKTKTKIKSDKGSLSQEASLPFGCRRYPGEEKRCAQRIDHGMIEK